MCVNVASTMVSCPLVFFLCSPFPYPWPDLYSVPWRPRKAGSEYPCLAQFPVMGCPGKCTTLGEPDRAAEVDPEAANCWKYLLAPTLCSQGSICAVRPPLKGPWAAGPCPPQEYTFCWLLPLSHIWDHLPHINYLYLCPVSGSASGGNPN